MGILQTTTMDNSATEVYAKSARLLEADTYERKNQISFDDGMGWRVGGGLQQREKEVIELGPTTVDENREIL